jgi:hypothetical protein
VLGRQLISGYEGLSVAICPSAWNSDSTTRVVYPQSVSSVTSTPVVSMFSMADKEGNQKAKSQLSRCRSHWPNPCSTLCSSTPERLALVMVEKTEASAHTHTHFQHSTKMH